jgi:hypothetical protein
MNADDSDATGIWPTGLPAPRGEPLTVLSRDLPPMSLERG